MSKFIILYVFDRNTYEFMRFDKIEISEESLLKAQNSDTIEAVHISSLYSPYNEILREKLNSYSIYISPTPGKVISSNRSILWLETINDNRAINAFIAYEKQKIKTYAESVIKFYKEEQRITDKLFSEIENPSPIVYRQSF